MGLLGDILVGAAGYGLPDAMTSLSAREERERERQRLLEQERMRDERYLAIERSKDQRMRDMQDEKLGVGLLAGGARGAGGRGGAGGLLDAEGYAAAYTRGRGEQLTDDEAAQVAKGKNPFTAASGEDREGNPIQAPDEARFLKVARVYNQALARGRAGAQADDLAKAEREEMLTQGGRDVMASGEPARAGLLGRTAAAMAGKGAYKVEGNSTVDQFEGDTEPTAVGDSAIEANKARAKQAEAGARENDAQADDARARAGARGTGGTPGKADAEGGKNARALVSSLERDLRNEQLNLTKVSRADRDAVRQRIAALQGKLEDARSALAKGGGSNGPDMARANAIKADFRAGKITREEAKRQLQAIGFQ